MSGDLNAAAVLASEYAAAFQEHLAGREEAALRRAYEAGRDALSAGLGPVEAATAHQSMIEKARAAGILSSAEALATAMNLLAESLAPYEMVIRGVHESNTRMQHSLDSLTFIEAQLRHQNEELTAARRAEEKQKGRYHDLFEFAPHGYLVTGIEGAIREANTAAAALLRTPREMLPGLSLSEFVREADRALFRERLRALQRGTIERIDDWQIELEPRNGPHVPAVLTVAAEAGSAATAGLRWMIRDDTQRQRAETEQASVLVDHARAEAERRFKFLAEASALLVGSLDVESSLIEIAELTAAYLSGWCFVNVIDARGSIRQLTLAHASASSADLASALRQHCLFGDGKSGEGQAKDRETIPGGAAGSQIVQPVDHNWYDLVADSPDHAVLLRRLHSETAMVLPLQIHGRRLGVLTIFSGSQGRALLPADAAVCEDLARRCSVALENARLYRDVVAERDKAERASGIKDEFVAILSHELRHPLTPLARWTRILENHPAIAADPMLAEAVKAMSRNAAALARLIDDCLDLTSITAGKLHLECELIDLNQVVRESVETVRASATGRGLRIRVEPSPAFVPVKGDALRLQQVVTNLLNNAVKYTDRGGTITVRTVCATEDAGIAVSDTGAGIQPDLIESVFEPFRQGTHAWLTSPSGLGLGLSIARQIVQMHGGAIWAESRGDGHGSTFRVRLPKAASEPAAVAGNAAAPDREDRKKRRILLVDDSDDILFLLKMELEMSGHEVVTARDGKEGLDAARAHHPDLIISDVKMLVMDGYSMIRAIRMQPDLRTIPAIALTGLGSKADTARALAAGFNACLSKPAGSEEIADMIRKLTPQPGGPVDGDKNRADKIHVDKAAC